MPIDRASRNELGKQANLRSVQLVPAERADRCGHPKLVRPWGVCPREEIVKLATENRTTVVLERARRLFFEGMFWEHHITDGSPCALPRATVGSGLNVRRSHQESSMIWRDPQNSKIEYGQASEKPGNGYVARLDSRRGRGGPNGSGLRTKASAFSRRSHIQAKAEKARGRFPTLRYSRRGNPPLLQALRRRSIGIATAVTPSCTSGQRAVYVGSWTRRKCLPVVGNPGMEENGQRRQ